jgi:hypothetical protein
MAPAGGRRQPACGGTARVRSSLTGRLEARQHQLGPRDSSRRAKTRQSEEMHGSSPPHGAWCIPGRTPAQPSVRAQDKAAFVPVPAPPRISHAPALDATLLSRPRAEQPPSSCTFFAACTAPVRPQEPHSCIPVRAAARALVPRVRFPQGGANLPPPAPALSSHAVPDTHT